MLFVAIGPPPSSNRLASAYWVRKPDCSADVRIGSKADITHAQGNVRLSADIGRADATSGGFESAKAQDKFN
jgi:hypothetical protein